MFLIEDRTDIEVGYLLYDSEELAACSGSSSSGSGDRYVQKYLKFGKQYSRKIGVKYALFLHGFEIITMPVYNSINKTNNKSRTPL